MDWLKYTLWLPLLVGAIALAPAAWAQSPPGQDTALRLIPREAGFCGVWLNNRRQYDVFVGSKAFEKIKQLQFVQLAWQQVMTQWENGEDENLTQLRKWLADPQNVELLQLLKQAVSDEVFVYGGNDYVEAYQWFSRLDRASQRAQLSELKSLEGDEAPSLKAIIEELNKAPEFQVPSTIIGFRVAERQKIELQISRLETLWKDQVQEQPLWKDRLQRVQVGTSSFLVLKVDGSMIPWDELLSAQGTAPPELTDVLKQKLGKATIAVALGVQGDYLLMAVGKDLKHLEAFGGGPSVLEAPELRRLSVAADRPLASISYASSELLRSLNTVSEQVDDLVVLAEELLPLSPLDADLQQEALQDARKLAEEVKQMIPKPGAMASVTVLNDDGYEGWVVDTSENLTLDASKPLDILNHAGANPMLVVASRQRRDLKLYDFGKRWLGRGLYYFERAGLPELEEEQQQTYQEVRGQVQPYLERFDQVTTQQFLPALSDGQQALVVDAQMATKQWHNEQPEAEEPLPLPSPALVLGVSDAAKLETAAKQYFQLAQEVMDRLHQQSPDEIPEIKIPAPSKREFPSGMIYYYSAPAEAGLHRWLAPNSGLSQQYLVLSVLPQQTQRLLQSNSLQATGPLSDPTRPLAVAVHVDFTAALDALKPWLRFGLKLARENAEEAVDQQVLLQMIENQSTDVLEVLRCINSYTAATYRDSEAMVTHFQWRLKDLP